ncbi:uncharacterized protein LOC122244312 [Penaeus japonicus]|uniref:uncharacterized protein LOC122244312 n=1 Tax=Penaeus japonicus TaxID=27405 RepID=UPI001C70C012|nr:uncharacterized protein LOC122244312 [Penaeus japonicus]XP_042858116.1 uncharacterized protein LOC122244312 [Penaeus japonicus]
MNERSAALTVGVALALVCVAWAAIPGPNDLRYPDYIVDPRVTCPKEGSFPHPRNCSWYYRCVDRMEIGYFWTYFFECEPGTVFADELDQCVHPYLAAPPCGSPPKTPKPTPTPTPTTTLTPVLCTGVDGTCKQYDICRPQRAKKTFCAEIRCNLRTSNLRCPAGKLFDMSTEQCTFPPKESDLCTGFKNINVSEQGQLKCSYDNLYPQSEFTSRLNCETYALCDAGIYQGQKELCRTYYECYRAEGKWQVRPLSCVAGLLYSHQEGKCVVPPTAAELCRA